MVRERTLGTLPCLVAGSGPPLVLLSGLSPENGLPTGIVRWTETALMRPLAEHFEVVWMPRPRGLARGTTLGQIAGAQANAIAAAYGRPVDVLGISTGGSLAQQLAADRPAVVRRLVLISTAGRLDDAGRLLQLRLAVLARRGARRQAFALFGSDVVPRWRGRTLARAAAALLGPVLYPGAGDLSDLAATLEAEDRFDLRDLAPIQAPTLLVAGALDRFYGQELFAETAALIPGARLSVRPGRGHVTVVGDRRTIAETIGFLSG